MSEVVAARPFVHLHCHSHFSLLDGASEIEALVKRAKEHGMNPLALTDLRWGEPQPSRSMEAGLLPLPRQAKKILFRIVNKRDVSRI